MRWFLNFVANNLIAVFVIAVIALIVVPLPTPLLDLMFIFSISASVIILLMTMYIRGPLEFSIFPSVLLVTTLLRIALNISSTRLILTNNGQAGQVIKTFGEFVLRGNIVVGLVIFTIIVIVQYLVITKGAERIAEVAARFTLDAMPGKQMAIDADLNSGLINETEARGRREKIQRESDFYGAMDGATKLVKGDAIASIIIAVINLVGGIIIGMVQGGGTFGEVVQIYSIATVGDGLVSQIPALVISIATAMVVTRAASEGNLNVEAGKQFLSQPTSLLIAGGVLICFCFVPGMPKPQLIALAAVYIFFGVRLLREQTLLAPALAGVGADGRQEVSETEFYRNIDNIYSILPVETIEMEFGYSLIPLVEEKSGGFIDRVVLFRRQFALDMGMVVPAVRLRDNGQLNPNQYVIKLKGEEVARGEILVDYYLALDPGNLEQEVDGIETIEPAYGIPSRWITPDKRELAEIYGYTVIDALSVMVTHLSEVIKAHAAELFSRQDLLSLLDNVRQYNAPLVDEVTPALLSYGNLQKLLSNLLREGIPIRDVETILETVADYAGSVRDVDLLTEYARQRLKRTITRRYAEHGLIRVLTLDAEIENMIIAGVKQSEHSTYLSIPPESIQDVVHSLMEHMNRLKDIITTPIVVTSPGVRMYFHRITEQFCPSVAVLSFNEIDSSVRIQSVGVLTLGAAARQGQTAERR
ncbi:MAG: flagellar biosynthesis protein FlhA [Gracilibacteraceae bacterium]|jgi:flagellar biosynthesis protein FlhA|nr:flagellar biosynthesis protein FlhA [Gracilibacteraceae bacterium]